MEQIAVSFTDWGVPKTWLTPKVNIIWKNWEVYITNWECKELWYWWYIYNFQKYSPEKVYLYQFDWGEELESEYDRYKFWGNEFDAYSNKYSWGRTAAPYFTNVNNRFNNVDKAIKDAVASRKEYNDTQIKKSLNEIKQAIKWKWGYDVYKRLDGLWKELESIKNAVMDTSSANDWNNSRNFVGINDKLDMMAEFVVKMKEDVAKGLWFVWDALNQSIRESNENINEWLANRVTIEQLLQQTKRIDDKLTEVVDSVVSERLPQELTDKFDLNVTRKPWMTNEEVARALWLDMWLSEWIWEGMNEWLEEWMSEGLDMGMEEWLESAREPQSTAPVDMQWIGEPTMPNQPL
jgi:uncharacterized protein YdcH (DUF465 family)